MSQQIGLILSQFPRYDEAFILREVVELSRGPWDLAIFSLRPCRDRVMHAQAKPLQSQTTYAPFVLSAAVWSSQGHFLRRSPGRYLGALAWVVTRHWRHPMAMLKTLMLFPKTVHFARLAQARGIQHLHAFWATYPASSAVIISRLTGIPYSMSGHAHDIYTTNPALAEKLRGARFTVTCTAHNQRHLRALGRAAPRGAAPARAARSLVNGAGDTIHVSYHGVDLSKFAATAKPGGEVCRILCVGSLLPCKGLETLIESCRRLKQRGVGFRCTIAGGGPLERPLRARIAQAGLAADVEITGYVSQETVAGLYQQAHVFVLPLVSRIHWGIPNVLIEALATKTPVVSCDLPSMAELVEHGVSGWIIPEQSPEALADALATLWADAPLRERLAEAGYSRVIQRFALEKTGAELRALFAEAMAGAAAA